VLRRIFGNGENPFDWALPLYTAWGIRVRIHLVFILMIAAEVIFSLPKDSLGWAYKALGMGSLFLLVLVHEYGHCIACRWVGGSADQILMWPLGGLAFCAPPHHWKADLITTLGGPAVNAILTPVFAGVLALLGQPTGTLLFNPFDPGNAIYLLDWHGTKPYWLVAIWWFHYMNLLLFSFNMLLVMYPMDAGRIVNALMWRKMGHRRAMDLSIKIGFVVGVGLFVFSMAAKESGGSRLMAIALFGLFTCWMEKQKLRMVSDQPALADYDFSAGYTSLPAEDEPLDDGRTVRARERQRKQEQDDQSELDRILAKIASAGMGSLSRAEKRWLERATERRRRG
jgi:Zn-dependent protease